MEAYSRLAMLAETWPNVKTAVSSANRARIAPRVFGMSCVYRLYRRLRLYRSADWRMEEDLSLLGQRYPTFDPEAKGVCVCTSLSGTPACSSLKIKPLCQT